MKRNLSVQLLDLKMNLFSGCFSCVKWSASIYSVNFFGVRQGPVFAGSVCFANRWSQ